MKIPSMTKKEYQHIKVRRAFYGGLLSLPPVVALAVIGVAAFTSKTLVLAPQGVFLSPVVDTSPLIISLSIFIIGYVLFIGYLFRDTLQNIVKRPRLP